MIGDVSNSEEHPSFPQSASDDDVSGALSVGTGISHSAGRESSNSMAEHVSCLTRDPGSPAVVTKLAPQKKSAVIPPLAALASS